MSNISLVSKEPRPLHFLFLRMETVMHEVYVVRWVKNGLTQRRFFVGDTQRVLALMIAGQQLGHEVRVEIETERGFASVSVQ